MINLLPPDVKQSYRYARLNVGLRRWLIIFLVALVGLGALATYGSLTLHQSTMQYNRQIATSQAQLKKENFNGTEAQVQDISNSFKLVVKVLGQEVLFSQLLKQIATITPSQANLTGLTISQAQNTVEVTAITPDYNTATQLQVNLADSNNKIFSKADIETINCSSQNAQDPAFPCTVTIRALFASNNPFLFINSKVTKP